MPEMEKVIGAVRRGGQPFEDAEEELQWTVGGRLNFDILGPDFAVPEVIRQDVVAK